MDLLVTFDLWNGLNLPLHWVNLLGGGSVGYFWHLKWVESTIILSQLNGWWISWIFLTDKMDRSYQIWPMKWVESTTYFILGGGSVGYLWDMVESSTTLSQVTVWWICWIILLTYEMGWIYHFTESTYWVVDWLDTYETWLSYHYTVSSYSVEDLLDHTFDPWNGLNLPHHWVNSTYWVVDLLDIFDLWNGLNQPLDWVNSTYRVVDLLDHTFDLWNGLNQPLHWVNSTYWVVDLLDQTFDLHMKWV